MSQFPGLKPNSRSVTVGNWPVASFVAMSGKETRILTGGQPSSDTLSLGFKNIQEPAVKQILDHYLAQAGTFFSFTLPDAVWVGWTGAREIMASTTKWRYTAPPSVKAVAPGIMDITVELVSLLE